MGRSPSPPRRRSRSRSRSRSPRRDRERDRRSSPRRRSPSPRRDRDGRSSGRGRSRSPPARRPSPSYDRYERCVAKTGVFVDLPEKNTCRRVPCELRAPLKPLPPLLALQAAPTSTSPGHASSSTALPWATGPGWLWGQRRLWWRSGSLQGRRRQGRLRRSQLWERRYRCSSL